MRPIPPFAPALVPALALALATAAAPAATRDRGPFVTIYAHDLGYVREARALDARAATDTLRLEDISNRLDFSSVRLAPASGRVRRLAYRWDVATGDGLFERQLGQRVRVSCRDNRVAEGALLSADGNWLVLRADDGTLATIARGAVEQVQFARAPGTLALKPAIEAVLEGARGAVDAELSYLTGGLSWSAEHQLVRTGETTGTWSTMVQVENTTGRDYVNATVKLVAGEPAREAAAPMPRAMLMRAAEAAPAADMNEASFSEYHLYTLREPATLRDRESQALVMVEPRPVTLAPRYAYRNGDPQGVLAQLEIVNSSKAGPGVPLAAGRVRTFQADDAGALQFTGERSIGHVPVDEKLVLDIGYAFDLAAERRTTYEKHPGPRERVYGMEVKLRNRKSVAATVTVEEAVGGDTEVTAQSQPSVRKDAGTLQWTVAVPAGREVVLTWEARQRW